MFKRIVSILCIFTLTLSLLGVHSLAALLDKEHPCSLTLGYTMGEVAFPDLEIRIYRVAQFLPSGNCQTVPPFDRYPVRINGISSQAEWQSVASTFLSHIAADHLAPTATQTTAADGSVVFSGLQTGLYLVQGVTAQAGNDTYIFKDFMIYLPTPVGGLYDYDCTAKPKCSQYTAPEAYKVVKLWKDSDADVVRPESVVIDILQDGVVQESVRLHSGNHWSYNWVDTDGKGVWTVVERDVPAGYVVTIVERAGTFLVTNTADGDEDFPVDPDDPNTPGDPGNPKPPVDPDDPDVPVDPDDPKPPVDPDNPKPPVDPDDPDIPVDPDDPNTPPADPDNPKPPVDPDDPDIPVDPDDPNKPTVDPDNPKPPVDPDDPDIPVDPGNPNKPNDPNKPNKPNKPNDSDNPKTGDTAPLWLYIIVMCLSGFVLMLVGIGSMRGKSHEKHW